jgi:hypothetical protein
MEKRLRSCIAHRTAAAAADATPKSAARTQADTTQRVRKQACTAQEKVLMLCD